MSTNWNSECKLANIPWACVCVVHASMRICPRNSNSTFHRRQGTSVGPSGGSSLGIPWSQKVWYLGPQRGHRTPPDLAAVLGVVMGERRVRENRLGGNIILLRYRRYTKGWIKTTVCDVLLLQRIQKMPQKIIKFCCRGVLIFLSCLLLFKSLFSLLKLHFSAHSLSSSSKLLQLPWSQQQLIFWEEKIWSSVDDWIGVWGSLSPHRAAPHHP